MGTAYEEMTSLASELNASRRARNLMEAFPKTVRFDLEGESAPFSIKFRDGEIGFVDAEEAESDIAVGGSATAFLSVLCDNVDVSHPIARGQLFVTRGKVSDMTMLNRILWSIKRRR